MHAVLATINRICTRVFDAVFGVMETWPGWLSLTILAGVTGVLAMLAYKYTSNQNAIAKVRDDVKANLLALKLYKDEITVTLRSIGGLFWAAARLLGLSVPPFLVMLVPMLLLLVQMAMRFEWRPLRPGEEAVLVAFLKPGTPENIAPLALELPPGIELATSRNRAFLAADQGVAERNSVEWRVRGVQPGRHEVKVRVGSETAGKLVDVSAKPHTGVDPMRPGVRLEDMLFYPREAPFKADGVIQRIEMKYQAGTTPIFGWNIHWVISYFILSMIIALLAKPFLKVNL